ncbi:MAG: ABC transporter permease [Candidatus Latescibacteria bacterium]|nr:ABC transporter permease [Candidatus Latescibacterota bacterium]
MKSYWAVVSARFRVLLQYRAAAVAGLVTQVFFGLLFVMVYEAFYRSTTTPQPMAYRDVVTYLWLGQALLGMFPWNEDREIRAMIRSGVVAYELVRPLDLYVFWFSRALALRTAPTLLRAIPMFIIAGIFFGLQPPPSWASAGAWMAATVVALLLSCAFTTLATISLLWTVSGEGLSQLMVVAVCILSGQFVPLPFFPDWAQPVLNLLPFRGLVDIPFRLYMGHISPDQAISVLTQQVAWTVALIVLGRWILSRGTRRLVVQGG